MLLVLSLKKHGIASFPTTATTTTTTTTKTIIIIQKSIYNGMAITNKGTKDILKKCLLSNNRTIEGTVWETQDYLTYMFYFINMIIRVGMLMLQDTFLIISLSAFTVKTQFHLFR